MPNSPHMELPLLQASQAQKHVTVNEALIRLDALAQLRLISVTTNTPPALSDDGDCYHVASAPVDEWFGQHGKIAIRSNGGWDFIAPKSGWTAWISETNEPAVFDGTVWRNGAVARSGNGAATLQKVVDFEHDLVAGPMSTIAMALPAGTIINAITGRVTQTISGTLTGWRVGVSGSDDRYGSGLGLAAGTWLRGLTSSPLSYYSDTDLVLTAEGGDFAGGQIRLAVHLTAFDLPAP